MRLLKSKNKKRSNTGKNNKRVHGSHFLKYVYIIGVTAIILTAGFFGYKAYNYFIYQRKIFILKKITIIGKGIGYREKLNILKLSGLYKGENLFSINLKLVSRLIASDRWIKNVTIYKKYPDKMIIVLKKRDIFAIISKGNLYYISKSGYVMGMANMTKGYKYPVITGLSENSIGSYPRKIKHALYFLSAARSSVISHRIGEVHIENDNGIIVYMHDGTWIKFGVGQYKKKLAMLKKLFYEINRMHLEYNQYINLEYKNEAVINVNKGYRVLPHGYKKVEVAPGIFK